VYLDYSVLCALETIVICICIPLYKEAQRYNNLIKVIKSSLVNLRKALKGEMVMSGELDKVCNALYNNLVPGMWEKVAYPSLMPLAAWVNDLIAR
jgi:dynein heavy chain